MTDRNDLNEKGQVLLEFILLFLAIVGISFTLLTLVNGQLGKRWAELGSKIIGPSGQSRHTLELE